MRTLLISLACMMLVGCAATTPKGMENMGSVDGYVYNAGNETQRRAADKATRDETVSTVSEAVVEATIDLASKLLVY